MADRDHPKTHVEDQELDELRKQPLSPRHEGIDPLTEGDTMLPSSNTQADSAKLAKKEDKEALDAAESDEKTDEKPSVVEDQEQRDAKIANGKTQADLEKEEAEKNGKTDGSEKTPADVKADRPAETPKAGSTGGKS